MRIALNKWFTLPSLGRDVFSDLMKAKVKYDTKFGFRVTAATDVARALNILSDALGQPVEIESSCFICEKPLESERAGSVICSECRRKEDAYTLYSLKFASLMEKL